ncbi:MAG TPA: diadenylate cyclase [Flavobacteriales bacterium]|jgi:diadenylate cyclase|nr:diadenylate cyclase [Flavobacteriales bacterium]
MFDFIHFRILDFIDIFLVALMLYYFYKLIKGTVAINIFIGIAILYLIWLLTKSLQMNLLSEFLGKFLGVGVLALIIVFQQEIRRFLLMIGSTKFSPSGKFMNRLGFKQINTSTTNVDAIIEAVKHLSKTKTGALIIIKRNSNLDFLKQSGDIMNIEVNAPILESIFFKNSPLHDGAVIIEGNKITATRTVLPISGDIRLPQTYGLRHRAAISITKNTDAVALVVSEETGKVSYVKDGKFVPFKNYDDLAQMLKYDLY